MRPIKFRAWDKKKKKMCTHGFYIRAEGQWVIFDDEDGGKSGLWEHDISEDYELELMQFTGLLDRNNREIWEGDIVQIHFYHDPDYEKVIGFIKWIESLLGFSIYVKTGNLFSVDFKTGGDFGNKRAVEVIGNIYENPELLESFNAISRHCHLCS